MTSVDVRPRCFRQRRLGILRNSHSPRMRTHSAGVLEDNLPVTELDYRSDVIDTSLKSSFEVDQVFQEKIRRLHQVRSDNALKNTRTQSCTGLKRKNNVIHDICSLRCSTAPSYGTVRQFLKDKIFNSVESETDSVFEENPTSNTLMHGIGRRNRLPTFPSINSVQNSAYQPQAISLSSPEKNEAVYLTKRSGVNDVTGGTLKSAISGSPKLRRTASAPAEINRNLLLREELLRRANQNRARHTYSSLVKNEPKRPIKTPVLRHTSLIRQNSTFSKAIPTNIVQLKSDSSPLGIIGEPCKSNKPPNFVRPIYKLPLRRPGLPNPIKISPRLPICPSELESVSKPVCVIPNESSNVYTGCGCRSVRFNCTDNLVYEYLTNDPVAVGVEAIKK